MKDRRVFDLPEKSSVFKQCHVILDHCVCGLVINKGPFLHSNLLQL